MVRIGRVAGCAWSSDGSRIFPITTAPLGIGIHRRSARCYDASSSQPLFALSLVEAARVDRSHFLQPLPLAVPVHVVRSDPTNLRRLGWRPASLRRCDELLPDRTSMHT